MTTRFRAFSVSLLVLFALATYNLAAGSRGASALAMPAAKFPIPLKTLFHDTRNSQYRTPFGAVPSGTAVTLRLKTGHKAVKSATLVVEETDGNGKTLDTKQIKMSVPAGKSRASGDLWQATFTPATIGIDFYAFRVQNGSAVAWYSSGLLQEGGLGQAYKGKKAPGVKFSLTVYDPQFKAPSWAPNAIIYQIFPDRFYNGDPSNDTKLMDPIYDNQHPFIHTSWTDKPIDSSGQPVTVQDFFGGDLQGVIDKLPYLKGLGVNTLWLTPIFLSPSNHKYDTSDYYTIDPHFGTMSTLQNLLSQAHADGIRIVLDGVFNHTGSDSIYFNRYGHFPDVGAYQSKSSPFYPWYTFLAWPTSYVDFSVGSTSYDTLPTLNENDAVKDFIFRTPDSVAQHWLAQGADGWRLDSAQFRSNTWWQQFRTALKAKYPEDILIAEDTGGPINATPFLLGNEFDGVMNYNFRDAITSFFANGNGSSGPTTATGFMNEMMSVVENYPLPALYSSMNLVDSHDTERILTDLQGNKTELKQIAAFQMTWLGAPTIYYGDEAGLLGGPDPDNRRTFPWDSQDTELESFYQKVIGIRTRNPALRDGSVSVLSEDNSNRVFAFVRKDASQSAVVAFNDGNSSRSLKLKISGVTNGATMTDQMTSKTYTVSSGSVSITVGAHTAAILTSTVQG